MHRTSVKEMWMICYNGWTFLVLKCNAWMPFNQISREIQKSNFVLCRLVEADLNEKVEYISKWITSHIEDGEKTLNKPIMFTEFGLSTKAKNFEYSHRIIFYKSIFNKIHESARQNGAGAGALIWQLLVQGMEDYNDDYGIVPRERPSVDKLIKEQSCQLIAVRYGKNSVDKSSVIC